MTFREMDNDKASEAMVRISAALSFICEDEEVIKMLNDINDEENMTMLVGVTKYMPKLTALAFRRHKDDLYEIVGALSQKDKKQVGKMNFIETVKLLQENWDVLMDFFPSSDSSTETTVTQSA